MSKSQKEKTGSFKLNDEENPLSKAYFFYLLTYTCPYQTYLL